MVEDGATYEEVKTFKENQILIKSINLVKEHAHEQEERRHSPERYRQVKNKVSSINPYASPAKRRRRDNGESSEKTELQKRLLNYTNESPLKEGSRTRIPQIAEVDEG